MALKITPAEAVSDGHVLLTGAIQGTVTTTDGTVYDVTPAVVEINPEHAGELAHLIGVRHEEEGTHPDHLPTPLDPDPHPFLHTCSDHCGAAAEDERRVHPVERLRAMGRDV